MEWEIKDSLREKAYPSLGLRGDCSAGAPSVWMEKGGCAVLERGSTLEARLVGGSQRPWQTHLRHARGSLSLKRWLVMPPSQKCEMKECLKWVLIYWKKYFIFSNIHLSIIYKNSHCFITCELCITLKCQMMLLYRK